MAYILCYWFVPPHIINLSKNLDVIDVTYLTDAFYFLMQAYIIMTSNHVFDGEMNFHRQSFRNDISHVAIGPIVKNCIFSMIAGGNVVSSCAV